MASLSVVGCCRAAVTVFPLDCMIRESGLSLDLSQRWKRVLCNSSSGRKAANVRRRFSRLDAHSGIKLSDMHMGMEPSDKVKKVEMPEDSRGFFEKAFLTAAIALMLLLDVEAASAAGGEFGLLEGRSVALTHPIVMGGLFTYTVYASYLGWLWRRVRTIQNEITEPKKQVNQVPVAAGDTSTPPPPPSPVEAQISNLTEERK